MECGRKLGFLKGYRHPTMGKKHLLCSNCFDHVQESVEQWREVVLYYSNFLNNNNAKNNHHFDFINIPKQLIHKYKMFDRLRNGREI